MMVKNTVVSLLLQNTEESKNHKRLIIKQIIKRLFVKKGKNTEGVPHFGYGISDF
jgi:hypothetical protein